MNEDKTAIVAYRDGQCVAADLGGKKKSIDSWIARGLDVQWETPTRAKELILDVLNPCSVPCYRCTRILAILYGGLSVDAFHMIVCDECGNKRCPRAKDHRFKCTGSNEPNQVGEMK